jgi:malonyl-CoA O-methyltransferase
MDERKEIIRTAFSRSASTYDSYADIQRESSERLSGCLEGIMPDSILEIGSATGNYTLLLSERFPGASILSVDFSDEMVRTAEAKLARNPNVQFVCADAEAFLPELEKRFDLVTSNATMQWFSYPDSTFREIKKLMADGGRLVFSIFGPETFPELKQALEHLYGRPVTLPTDAFLKKDDLLSMLEENFKEVELEEINFTRKYASTFQLLRHIKKTGTTGGGSRPHLSLNRSRLRIMDDWFKLNHGECTATYQLFFIKASK